MPDPISYAEMIAAVKLAIERLELDVEDGKPIVKIASALVIDNLRAVLAHLERTQWRPIEEAPRDKDWLLVGAEGHTPADSWCEPAFWHDGSRNYWERAGWYALEDRGNVLTAKPLTGTTHYMLPPSPETP